IGQRYIRCTCVLAAQAPRRLAMSEHKHAHVPTPCSDVAGLGRTNSQIPTSYISRRATRGDAEESGSHRCGPHLIRVPLEAGDAVAASQLVQGLPAGPQVLVPAMPPLQCVIQEGAPVRETDPPRFGPEQVVDRVQMGSGTRSSWPPDKNTMPGTAARIWR